MQKKLSLLSLPTQRGKVIECFPSSAKIRNPANLLCSVAKLQWEMGVYPEYQQKPFPLILGVLIILPTS